MQILVLGAGQLARMMSLAGAPLGLQISAFDVNTNQVVHPLTGQLLHNQGLEKAIKDCEVITAEFEHIPLDILKICQDSGKLKPSAQAIATGGDRRIEKTLLDDAKVANAPYAIIHNQADFNAAIESVGLPMVLKTALGGYDGKGQWRLKDAASIETTWQEIEQALQDNPQQGIVAEKFIPFDREVSIVGARNAQGEVVTYQLAQNVHLDGVLRLSQTIDDKALQQQAEQMFTAVANTLDYVGILAIEFFDVQGQLLVNEIAPRVHNSGHWTQQGSDVCQFENHLRAVANLPLGNTNSQPAAMINILGQDKVPEVLLSHAQCHVHWYGKEKRPGRKMGHINLYASSQAQLRQNLFAVADILDENAFPQLTQMIESMPS
ncbi:MAG: 5-(carboxyamino)imidazole ribonucleotide synthase [Vibrio sp.]